MKEGEDALARLGLDVRDLLNTQTAKLSWGELQPHFARGIVLVADADLDLVEVAAGMVQDRRDEMESWLDAGRLVRANTDHARNWQARNPTFWAVVVAPWLLVQEVP